MLTFSPELQELFSGADAFDRVLTMQGEVYRDHKGRRTLRFEHAGKGYFLKIHPGVGWREIIKNLLFLRLPVLGACHEHAAILALEKLGVATMQIAGYGRRGLNPARRESFLITEEIAASISLEDLARDWPAAPPALLLKRKLLRELARIAATLHHNGVNHRDFYLCHFLLECAWLEDASFSSAPPLHVIDLHRTQVRRRTPRRWIVKDLAGLYFSAMDAGLSRRDLLRFVRLYTGLPLKRTLRENASFWRLIESRAQQLYRKHA